MPLSTRILTLIAAPMLALAVGMFAAGLALLAVLRVVLTPDK